MILLFLFIALIFLSPHVSAAEGNEPSPNMQWTEDELSRNAAVKTLRTTAEASFHLIRLKGAEPPHVHDRHDLTVFIFSGTSVVHFKDRAVSISQGELIDIPRGVWHWAENIGQDPTHAYAVFTPPFDGKDRRLEEHQ
jgi:mannose-6-phosphate isomerase-like protein (cupin superfamily)